MSFIRRRKHPSLPAIAPTAGSSEISALHGGSLLAATGFALAVAPFANLAQAADGAATLPAVTVKSAPDVPFRATTSASPKATQSLLDTPQTISVIKKELLQEQGIASVVEALRNTPGITLQLGENGNTSAGDTFQMRGFATESALFVDGLRDVAGVTRDAFNIDQLEVVKGPAGADVGRGASAGYVNLITKQAQSDEFSDFSAALNSAGNLRATMDLNRAINDSSAFRINLVAAKGDTQGRNEVQTQNLAIAPALALGLNSKTRIYLYSQHVRQDNRPDGGVPTIGLPGFYNADPKLNAGARVDSKNYYGSLADNEKISADMISAKFEHELGNKTVLRNLSRYARSSIERVLTGVNALQAPVANPMGWTVARTRQRIDRENELLANQTTLNTEFAAGGFEHSLAAGLELLHEKQTLPTFAVPSSITIPPAGLYAPLANIALPMPQKNGAFTNGSTSTVALYAFDSLKLSKEWQLNAGVRYEHYSTQSDLAVLSTATSHPQLPVGTLVPSNLKKSGNLLNWRAGLVYKPVPYGSIYAAIANSYTPPGSANFALSATAGNINSPALEPQKTTNLELGSKWEVLDKRLTLSVAAYRTDNKNEIAQLDAQTNTYAQFGKRRVQGVEFGAVGQITPNWQISAGVAGMSTKVLQGSSGNNSAGAASRWSPELSATLWTSYKVNPQWTVGGGARYLSEQLRVVDPALPTATQVMPKIASYTVFDALLSYQLSRQIGLQLNIYNLFNRDYIASLNNSGARYMPGAKRSAQLTANLRF